MKTVLNQSHICPLNGLNKKCTKYLHAHKKIYSCTLYYKPVAFFTQFPQVGSQEDSTREEEWGVPTCLVLHKGGSQDGANNRLEAEAMITRIITEVNKGTLEDQQTLEEVQEIHQVRFTINQLLCNKVKFIHFSRCLMTKNRMCSHTKS